VAITGVTRRALFSDLANRVWWGNCRDELEFMDRLYDLDELPSTDPRFTSAREDFRQHRLNNADWYDEELFADPRFRLSAGDDEPLLRFLAESVHPEVRDDPAESARLVAVYNRHLRPDGWELFRSAQISQRPVYGWRPVAAPEVSLDQLRDAIADAIAELKSYDVAEFCVGLGLPGSEAHDDDPFHSKRTYVKRRIKSKTRSELMDLAADAQQRLEDPALQLVIDATRAGGPKSKLTTAKQLIFAALPGHPKPQIVLSDAVSKDVVVVKHAEGCLHYNEPVHDSGLTWRQLARWWEDGGPDEHERARRLHRRLLNSLGGGPEKLILHTYARLYGEFGFDIPALLPQVYLHYDPYARRHPDVSSLARQRMDFLLLVPNRHRIVIELDGKQHYSDDRGNPSPERYGQMMREDRKLRLAGYEVFRFGGHELTDRSAGEILLRQFFIDLLTAHDVSLGP
jgi:AbiJ N-terminal domain 3